MAYNRVNWQNGASGGTPINAENLNKMDAGISTIDSTVTAEDGTVFKFTKSGGKYGYKDGGGTFHPFKEVEGEQTLSVTVNGTYTVEPSTSDYDGIEKATITVNVSGGGGGAVVEPTKTATASTNDITVTPSAGYDAIAQVKVHPTPSEAKTLTITENGTYPVTPSSGKLLSGVSVDVNVSGGASAEAIWTNANPNTAFNNQIITLSKSYQAILIVFKESTTSNLKNSMFLNDNSASATGFYIAFAQATTRRRVKWTQGSTSLVFSDASSTSSCIPLAIYGLDIQL